jgi:hypothetical protein
VYLIVFVVWRTWIACTVILFPSRIPFYALESTKSTMTLDLSLSTAHNITSLAHHRTLWSSRRKTFSVSICCFPPPCRERGYVIKILRQSSCHLPWTTFSVSSRICWFAVCVCVRVWKIDYGQCCLEPPILVVADLTLVLLLGFWITMAMASIFLIHWLSTLVWNSFPKQIYVGFSAGSYAGTPCRHINTLRTTMIHKKNK